MNGTQTAIAWATGLFEGEGCITNRSGSVSLRLVSTDRDVVEKFQAIMGFGKIGQQAPSVGHNKTLYHTSIVGRKAERPLLLMLPHLCSRRRERAITALLDIAFKHPLIRCDNCAKVFTRHHPSQHYCSRTCKNALRRAKVLV